MYRLLMCFLSLGVLVTAPLAGQVHPAFERGYDPARSFPTAELDSVNLFNGNLTFAIPLADYPVAGGLSYGLRLIYNSNVWDFSERFYQGQFVAAAKVSPGTNAGLGFRLHFGRLLPPVGMDDTLENQTTHWIYEGPDGSRHVFVERLHAGESSAGNVYYTRDGSYLRLKVVSNAAQEVHFPDGTVHTVTRIPVPTGHLHRVTEIEDPHGNAVTFAYASNDRTWKVTDDRNRTHTVTLSPLQPGLPPMVTRVELESFGGATATWTFTYQTKQLPVPCQNSDPAVTQVPVPLLTQISGPEGLTYSMPASSYADTPCTGGQAVPSGPLVELGLPTGGAIEWDYGRYVLGGDGTAGSGGGPLGGKPELHIRSSEGVVERRLVDGSTTVGSWRYTPSFEQVTRADGTLLITERRTTVRDPLEHQRVHYFSAAVETTQTGGWHPREYSLPFTRDASRSGRFLSREVFNEAGTRLRSVYVGYEMDPLDPHTPTVNLWDRNRREQSMETVYHDDGNRWASVTRSDFDGLGHYRTTTTGGNFGAGDTKTTFRDWNPSRGTFGQAGYSPFPEGSRWTLGTYGEERVTEGGQTVRQTCFDEAKGLLLRERIQEASNRRSGDIIRRFTYDTAGQRTRTEQFGGDGQAVSTSSNLCSLGLPDPLYRQHHTSQHGVLSTTTWTQPNGTPLTWKTLDLTIDRSSGLPSSSRDTAGFQTTYSWDRLGRLAAMTPAEGARTETTYSFPGSSLPARAQVKRLDGSTATLTDEEVRFDPFGRLALERRRMPDGGWSERATATDALGNTTSRSEWGALGATTRFLDHDPFGRPGRIRPPEGSSHDVLLWYSGVRSKTTVSKRATDRTAQGDIVESNVQHTEITDRQGRLWKVREPEWPAGSGDRPETIYEYDAADRLVRVEMGGDGAIQPPPPPPNLLLFSDGFESGDLRCWKRVVGGAAQNVGTGGPSCSGPAAAKAETGEIQVTQVRTFSYDGRGFLLTESHPELSTATTYGDYDPLGNPGSVTRGGITLDTTYDRAGRPLLTSQDIATPGGTFARPWKEWTYSTGNFSGHGSRSQGKLATAVRHNWIVPPGGSTEIDLAATEHYVYDGLAGRTSQVRTSLNTSGYEWRTSFGYDALGDLSSITYPNCVSGPCQAEDVARTVTFDRTRGLLTSVPGYASSLTYHDNGMVNTVTHANNVVDTQTVDPSGRARPGSLTSRLGGTALWNSGSYSYDGSGNITKIGSQDWYLYDPLGRLSESSQRAANGVTYAQSFLYDRFGNLLSIGPRTFGVDTSTNRLTTAGYDASGAVTSWAGQTFERDPFDMIHASEDWIYVYGPGDERLWTIHAPTPDGSTWTENYTLRGLGGEMLRDFELVGGSVSGIWSVERDTVYRDGRVLAVVSPTETQHASLDHLGTPRLWTGPGGVVRKRPEHLPYGEPVVSSDQKLQFTGHERDERGAGATDDLDYMHARYYSPHLGRFLSVDPVLAGGGSPQSWNRYSYGLSNPSRFVDPDGRTAVGFYGFGGDTSGGVGRALELLVPHLAAVGGVRGFYRKEDQQAVDFILNDRRRRSAASSPVVVFGHSRGAVASVRAAELLSKTKGAPNVDLLVTIDAAPNTLRNLVVPANVATAINFYQSGASLGGQMITAADKSKTSVFNVELNASHTGIDELVARAVVQFIVDLAVQGRVDLKAGLQFVQGQLIRVEKE